MAFLLTVEFGPLVANEVKSIGVTSDDILASVSSCTTK